MPDLHLIATIELFFLFVTEKINHSVGLSLLNTEANFIYKKFLISILFCPQKKRQLDENQKNLVYSQTN